MVLKYYGLLQRKYYNVKMEFLRNDYAVDACSYGNPGGWGCRGVNILTKQEFFRFGIYDDGTNNIGEYVGIVYALSHLSKIGVVEARIFSDSTTGIAWVKHGINNSKHISQNEKTVRILANADNWLKEHPEHFPVLKWETRLWGENPADYGRK